MDLLLLMGSSKSGRSILKTIDLFSFKHKVVKFLPVEYNGNCIFELPPSQLLKKGVLVAWMESLQENRDRNDCKK